MGGRALNSRMVRYMRTGPIDGIPLVGGGGGGTGVGQGQQQGGGQQGAGGGGPPAGQQGQQQQGQGQQGGQGQQQQDPYADLFNNARNDGGQQGQPGQQQGQQGGQGGGQQLPDNLADVIGRAVESAVDRRINAINNPGGGRNRNQGQQGQGDGQGQGNGQQQQVAAVDQGARREARLAFREYLGDQIRFLSDTERNAAVQIGTAMIATWDGQGDADQFGRQVSAAVAQTVKDLAEMYRRTAVEALRKQGLLKEQPQGPGAGSGFAATSVPTGAGSGFVLPSITGAANVTQKDPQRALNGALAAAAAYNQQAGHIPAGQQQQTS
jgi:hypothetical protein